MHNIVNGTNGTQNVVQQTYIKDLMHRERARMEEYIKAREYYDGVQQAQLTDRARQYLNVSRDAEFTINYCPMVVDAKADRLTVSAFDTDGDEQSDMLWDWWRKNRMDRTQGIVHRAAVRDGDAFVLVEWDEQANMPRFYYEPAYAGEGVMVYYSEEHREEIAFASKHWVIKYGSNTGKMRRKNLYFPDRIEKYVSHDDVNAGAWQPYRDDNTDDVRMGGLGMAGVNWWTDDGTENGEPLGVPVVHFKHNDTGEYHGTSHLAKVMPIQDAVNKSMIDMLAVMDTAGFGLLVGTGTDAWTGVKVAPGAIAAVSKPANEANLTRLPGDNPEGLLKVYNALVMEIARVSGTPLSYMQSSGQVAAEGTMKQQEVALITQVKKSQVDFGNAWEDVMMLARRLHNAFSTEPEMDTDIIIDTIWEDAESRNDKEEAETLAIKVEKLGVSEEQALTELGYNATEIAAMLRAKLRRDAMAIRISNGTRAQANAPPGESADNTDEDNAQELTQTENEETVNETAGA